MRRHRESIFFGLSLRQFVCAALAVGAAAGVYLGLGPALGKDTAGWLCIIAAAPPTAAGFYSYNGLSFEQLLWAVIKSEILCAGGRRFASKNIHYELLGRKEAGDYD